MRTWGGMSAEEDHPSDDPATRTEGRPGPTDGAGPEVDLDQTVVRTEDQMSADLGDENVVLDLDAGVYYGMRGVGVRIWSLLEEPRPGTEILDRLLDEYDVAPDQCEADLRAFLANLRDEGLIEVVGSD